MSEFLITVAVKTAKWIVLAFVAVLTLAVRLLPIDRKNFARTVLRVVGAEMAEYTPYAFAAMSMQHQNAPVPMPPDGPVFEIRNCECSASGEAIVKGKELATLHPIGSMHYEITRTTRVSIGEFSDLWAFFVSGPGIPADSFIVGPDPDYGTSMLSAFELAYHAGSMEAHA